MEVCISHYSNIILNLSLPFIVRVLEKGACSVLSARAANLYGLLRVWASILSTIVMRIGTLPYYRFFQYNTYDPIIRIAGCTKQKVSLDHLLKRLSRWRLRKLMELQFVSLAVRVHLYMSALCCSIKLTLRQRAVLAAAVIGSFSWNIVQDAYWLAPAMWHGCLLSVL